MPILHGFSYSNYYNQLSPALKVASLTSHDGQHLSEAAVLFDYIEDTYL